MGENSILWEETIQPGATWSHVLKRGTALRLTDPEGGANVAAIFYNFECPTERLNIPDTLKAQHIARLTSGFVLYSDMGRILCSITADTAGWHDPLGGVSNAKSVLAQYGPGTYQECRNDYHKNAYDGFLIELGKWGLGPRDLTANVNFFSRVDVDAEGALSLAVGNSKPGSFIELRAEMNVLAILNTCQHPLDPNPKYQPKPVHLVVRRAASPAAGDPMPNLAPGKRPRIHADGEVFSLMTQSKLDPSQAIYTQDIPAGEPWIHEIRKGQIFRIVDLHGNQAVDTLFYNAHDYSDRYSAQDTIRAQRNLYLTTGTTLMSSNAEPLLTIVADTCGRHDTLGGACSNESNMVRYAIDKRHMHACRASFLKAVLQSGLGLEKRDIPANINFFMNVPVTPEGKLTFEDGISEPGKYVEMRAEKDVLALISNCPQLNNPCNAYNPTPVRILIWDAGNG